ncbi:amidohydrolase [Alteromonas sp. a30]|uniref:amidohydrolase n=1 Tax=Alteromonas sp. a30 TaxID=2730917 RepID=UPI00227E2FCF|nr:amidohydrolase [Alteromonas sp. a30]MCY7296925.1 amidohydrolase [Alteromonas sp. a30]
MNIASITALFVASFCLSPLLWANDIVINAKGYTLNDQKVLSEFTAMAFDGNKITGVYAKTPDLKGFDNVIDAKGKTLLPGLIDAHGHVMAYGQAISSVDLVGTQSLKDAQAKIKAQLGKVPTGWVVGHGWNQELWQVKQFPTASDIDGLMGERPVVFSRIDGHAIWVNSKALTLAGITTDTSDPEGGEIIRDKQGKPTGVLVDNAMGLVYDVMPKPTMAQRKTFLQQSLKALAATGLTSVHDAGIDPETIAAYHELQAEGNLPIRVYAMLDITSEDADAFLQKGPYQTDDAMFALKSVKISADGALGSRGAALHDDYSDRKGQKGLLLHTISNLNKYVAQAMQAGFQVNTHAIGDRANTLVLDAYEKWLKKDDMAALRHRIEHAQVVRPHELQRFADLHMIASMQPTHATSDKNMAEDRLGKARMKGAYAWASLQKLGVLLAGGSDFPIEPAEPFYGLHAAVTRQDRNNQPLGGWYANEAVDRETALAMFTYNAAYAAHQESMIGSIEVGKQADFILVEDDYFEVKPEDIWKVKVAQTWVAGKQVY